MRMLPHIAASRGKGQVAGQARRRPPVREDSDSSVSGESGAAMDLQNMSPVALAAMIRQLENERARAEKAEAKVEVLMRGSSGAVPSLFGDAGVAGTGAKQPRKKALSKKAAKKKRLAAKKAAAARTEARLAKRNARADRKAMVERAAVARESWEARLRSLRVARDKQAAHALVIARVAKEKGAKARALVMARRNGGVMGSAQWRAQQQALARRSEAGGIEYVPRMPPPVAGQMPLWQQQESIFRFGTTWWDEESARDTDGMYKFLNEINGMSIVAPKVRELTDRDFAKMTARQIAMLPPEQRAPAEAARKARQKRLAAKRKARLRREKLAVDRRLRYEQDLAEARARYERYKPQQGGGVGLRRLSAARGPLWAASVMLHFFRFVQVSWIRAHRPGGMGDRGEMELAAKNWRAYRDLRLEQNNPATALLGESGIRKFLGTHFGERVFNETFKTDEWLCTFDSAFPGSKGYGAARTAKHFGGGRGSGKSKSRRRHASVCTDEIECARRIQAQWRRVMAQNDFRADADEVRASFLASLAAAPRAHAKGVFLEVTAQRTRQLVRQFEAMGAEDTAKALDARDFWDPVWKYRCKQCPPALRLDFEEAFLCRPPAVRQEFVDLLPGLVALGDETATRMKVLADALLAMPIYGTAAEIGPHCVSRMTLDLYAKHCPAPV